MTNTQKILFFLGQVGMMSLARFFFQWIIRFSTSQDPSTAEAALFSAGAVGAWLLVFRIFDGVTDPIAGSVSDWWVSRGGKRKNLMMLSILLPGIGLILCFAPTHALMPSMRWALLLSGMLLFFLGYTFYAIPYWSLISDYAGTNDDLRRQLSNLLGAGLLLATAIGFVISPPIIQALGYRDAALVFAALATLGMAGPYFAEPAHTPETPPTPAPKNTGFEGFSRSFRDRRFLALIALFGGSQMSLTIMTSASPFIAVNLLGGTEQDVALLLGPLLGAAFPCFLVAPALSRRFHWERLFVIASLLLGLVYCLCGSVGTAVIGTPFVTAALLFATAGPMIALLLALEGEAVTDCARQTGDGAVSMYWGVFNLVVKTLNGGAIFLAGILAERSLGPSGEEAVRWMMYSAGIAVFLGLIGFTVLRRSSSS